MTEAEAQGRLIDEIASMHDNPLAFAQYALPWGEGQIDALRKWQVDVLKAIRDHLKNPKTKHQPCQIAVASGHGVGKATHCNTIIPTPSGDKTIKELIVGDYVYGRDGKPTSILAIKNNGVRPVYRVEFDDGSHCLADENHDWAVKGRQERRRGLDTWRVLSTKQILDAGVQRSNGRFTACQWEIPTCAPVEGFINHRAAYAVGIWIGDGGRGTAQYTKKDHEIAEHIRSLGLEVSYNGDKTWGIKKFAPELKRLGLFQCHSYSKFLPKEVWSWTSDSRMELLRGLLDSDGECNPRGTIIYSTTSKRLIVDIQRLARSLGFKAQEQAVKAAYLNGVRHRDCYRACITIPSSARPFYVKRKGERTKEIEARYQKRWIKSIKRVEDAETICIQVEAADHLFLANDYVVTHNSFLLSTVIAWALSTMPDTRIVVTANTDTQLRTKTWPEVGKVMRLLINSDWFVLTATAVHSADDQHVRTWRADAVPWSENNTEAFAGLHNRGKRIVVIFDEASSISDKVWEVTEGALTDEDTEIIWLCFGNPTRNSGRFRQCFSKYKNLWHTRQIDSSKVEGTNKVQIQKWKDTYGEDSDFVRVRVLGKFPRASSMQLIDSDRVHEAQKRDARYIPTDPLLMALDIARGGNDNCVIRFRRGRDAKSYPVIKIPGSEVKDSMRLVSKVIEVIREQKPDYFFYDGTGVGGPVGDRIKQLGYKVIEVQFGSKSPDEKCANLRAYMWKEMNEWLAYGAIDEDQTLETDLTSVEYAHNKNDQLLLESKESMKARGLASPDDGDALAMTFSFPVASKDDVEFAAEVGQVLHEYDPFGDS